MRITIHQQKFKDMVQSLCDERNCSPTQLILALIERESDIAQEGCNCDKRDTQHKLNV